MWQPSGVGDTRPLALALRTRVPAERCLGGCGARKPTGLSCLLRADAAWEPMAYLLQRSRVRRPVMLHAKRHPKWVPFCMELTSHQLGKSEPGVRFFRFSYVQPKQIWNRIIIYWIEAFYKIRLAIQEPVTSLVRGHGK